MLGTAYYLLIDKQAIPFRVCSPKLGILDQGLNVQIGRGDGKRITTKIFKCIYSITAQDCHDAIEQRIGSGHKIIAFQQVCSEGAAER